MLENSLVSSVQYTGVQGVCKTEDTGVWVKTGDNVRKICSLGLNIKRNITSHGISMNVHPSLEYLNNAELVICGLHGKKQTSLAELGITNLSVDDMAYVTVDQVAKRMTEHMKGENMVVSTHVIASKDVDEIIMEMDSVITNRV